MAEVEKFGGLFRRIGDAVHIGAKKFKGKSILSSDFGPEAESSLISRLKSEDFDGFRKNDGFIVKDPENAILLQSGSLVGVAGSGIYELDKSAKRPGSEIIWVTKREFIIKWGTPGIYTSDNIMVGCYGISRMRVVNPRNFIMNVVSHKQYYSGDELKNWVKQTIIAAVKHVLSRYSVPEMLKERRSLEIQTRSELGPETSRWGLELVGLDIGGFKVPDEYQALLSYEVEKQVLEQRRELAEERKTLDDISEKVTKYEQMLEQADELFLSGKISEEKYKELTDKYSRKLAQFKAQMS
ncbi:MAG: SPFH domain-containing protein [Candidatus Heimdallarchaeota archaeon]|nr:MAG: SPFH domain-containing protein [Candidatus Heimdallarchaeota archaeon]